MEEKLRILLKKTDNVKKEITDLYVKVQQSKLTLEQISFSSACCDLDEALELVHKVSTLFNTNIISGTGTDEETEFFTNDESLFSDPSTDRTETNDDLIESSKTKLNDNESDVTDDLENFDHYNIDDDGPSTSKTSVQNNQQDEDSTKESEPDDFRDEFGDGDFDESALMELDEAEKSLVDDVQEDDEDDPQNQPHDQKYLEVLKQYFGYSKFRPMQWKIVNSVLNEKKR